MTKSAASKNNGAKVQIFLSYRRDNGADLARLVWETLKQRRYAAFMDVEDLRSGPFNTSLYEKIAQASDFLVILTPNALDRCHNEGDWLRLEIAYAFQTQRNVIPVVARGFQWPAAGWLPPELAALPDQQAVVHSHELFKGSMDKLEQLLVARPRRRNPLPVTVILLATLAGVWFLARMDRPAAGEQTDNGSPSTPPAATHGEYVRIKTDAESAWQKIQSLEPFNGIGPLVEQARQKQRLAAEYEQHKDEALAGDAYRELLEGCRAIEEKLLLKLQVQTTLQETQNLMRTADSSFTGTARPISFLQGKQALDDAERYWKDGYFETAQNQITQAAGYFSAAQTEAGAYNRVAAAQDQWNQSLAAADTGLLGKFVPGRLQSARLKARDAETQLTAGNMEAATALLKEAAQDLQAATAASAPIAESQEAWNKALAAAQPESWGFLAKDLFTAAMAEAAAAKSNIDRGQTEEAIQFYRQAVLKLTTAVDAARTMAKAGQAWTQALAAANPALLDKFTPGALQSAKSKAEAAQAAAQAGLAENAVASFQEASALLIQAGNDAANRQRAALLPPVPSVPPEEVRAYLDFNSSTADPIKGKFQEYRNRFHKTGEQMLQDAVLKKNWVLYNPDVVMDWDTAQRTARLAGGRLPTLRELKTLITKNRLPSDWASINTTYFPIHHRTTRFWTGDKAMFSMSVYIDFNQLTWDSASSSDHQGVLIIKD